LRTDVVWVGLAQPIACVTVTVLPGAPVTVTGGRVKVVVEMLVTPGKVDTTVVPAAVIVVKTPGRVTVTKDVVTEPGRVVT
jgi:hypothetical protein